MMFDKKDSEILSVLPLRDIVIFPKMIIPLFVGRESSIEALEYAGNKSKNRIFLTAQKDASLDKPSYEDIFKVGTISQIIQVIKLPDNTVKILVEGLNRAEIKSLLDERDGFFEVEADELETESIPSNTASDYINRLMAQLDYALKVGAKISSEVQRGLKKMRSSDEVIDYVAGFIETSVEKRQKLLEMIEPFDRMDYLSMLIDEAIEVAVTEKRVKNRVKNQMETSQKEYYLNEQMKAIRKELGKKDKFAEDIDELKERIEKANMPPEVEEKARKELRKLETMTPMFAEAAVIRNYIEWLINLPWKISTKDNEDLKRAETILEEDHYGLREVKDRIIEYLAVQQKVKKLRGPILCFVGPPGVGKTSLGKSIARALDRKFIRISLGGVHDEAEIRGHRRTYVAALPGRIIQAIRRAGSNNPVFLMDEIDKIGSDFRGDPSSALLEVLDPEQNDSFSDHYLEVDFDLSNVLFITTANVLHTIPPALKDRMEIIRLPGYTEEEKIKIAEKFLVPKQLDAHGLKDEKIIFTEEGLIDIIRKYTREAGVRNLEREISSICRKVTKKLLKGELKGDIIIDSDMVHDLLGTEKFSLLATDKKDTIGMAHGLAWTEIGGQVLITEAVVVDGKGNLSLTGQLGDVMKESAQAALSYIRSRSEMLGLPKDFYQKIDIHLHVPEGAIPKDGPSAGITIAVAMISSLIQKPVLGEVAMTGEITLRGRVLKIGGLKEKALAAHRQGIYKVIIPKENEKEISDLPENIVKDMTFFPAETMDEVVKIAFSETPFIHPEHARLRDQSQTQPN